MIRDRAGPGQGLVTIGAVAGRECYHCKQWVENGTAHDCWTTTEAALTAELSEDLREAWERLRETAVEFGEQRIYASHSSIMFSRKVCYFFVRPKKRYLEAYRLQDAPPAAPKRVTKAEKTKAVRKAPTKKPSARKAKRSRLKAR